jgi:hypothetical protein
MWQAGSMCVELNPAAVHTYFWLPVTEQRRVPLDPCLFSFDSVALAQKCREKINRH